MKTFNAILYVDDDGASELILDGVIKPGTHNAIIVINDDSVVDAEQTIPDRYDKENDVLFMPGFDVGEILAEGTFNREEIYGSNGR